MRTVMKNPSLLLLALALTTFLSACSGVSAPPSIKQTPPRVDCVQGSNPPLSNPPASDEWIACKPTLDGEECTLSEKAALWVVEAVTLLNLEGAVRKREHACLDKLVDEGVIRR